MPSSSPSDSRVARSSTDDAQLADRDSSADAPSSAPAFLVSNDVASLFRPVAVYRAAPEPVHRQVSDHVAIVGACNGAPVAIESLSPMPPGPSSGGRSGSKKIDWPASLAFWNTTNLPRGDGLYKDTFRRRVERGWCLQDAYTKDNRPFVDKQNESKLRHSLVDLASSSEVPRSLTSSEETPPLCEGDPEALARLRAACQYLCALGELTPEAQDVLVDCLYSLPDYVSDFNQTVD